MVHISLFQAPHHAPPRTQPCALHFSTRAAPSTFHAPPPLPRTLVRHQLTPLWSLVLSTTEYAVCQSVADPSLVSPAGRHSTPCTPPRTCKQHLAFATLQRTRYTLAHKPTHYLPLFCGILPRSSSSRDNFDAMPHEYDFSVPLRTSSTHEGLPHYHATPVRPCTHYHAQSPASPPLALAPHYSRTAAQWMFTQLECMLTQAA